METVHKASRELRVQEPRTTSPEKLFKSWPSDCFPQGTDGQRVDAGDCPWVPSPEPEAEEPRSKRCLEGEQGWPVPHLKPEAAGEPCGHRDQSISRHREFPPVSELRL